jgi:hypothetical protein
MSLTEILFRKDQEKIKKDKNKTIVGPPCPSDPKAEGIYKKGRHQNKQSFPDRQPQRQ